MPVNQQRAEALDRIARTIEDLFPHGVTFNRAPEAAHNFIACWPLVNQPEHLSQISREVSVRFSEDFLLRYEGYDEAERLHANQLIRAFVQANRQGYSEGREIARGGLKEPFVIDTSHGGF